MIKWIKTSEKLPDLYETVVVTVRDEERTYTSAASLQRLNPIEWEHGVYDYHDEVIAWMPLPEPYKEEQ